MQYREKRSGEEVFVCLVADGTAIVIPAWMFDQAFCSRLKLGPPRVSTDALRELKGVLDEFREQTGVASAGTLASEVPDDEALRSETPTQSRTNAAATCSSSQDRGRTKGTDEGDRTPREHAPSVRRCKRGTRGVR